MENNPRAHILVMLNNGVRIIIIHLLGLAPAEYLAASDSGP
jgi:hypothetical protein